MEIPEKFTDLISTNVKYMYGETKIEGRVLDCRFSRSAYMDTETHDQWHGVELKIKPTNGFNANKAIWTKAFNSGIPIDDNL